jgi:hypothetical protein
MKKMTALLLVTALIVLAAVMSVSAMPDGDSIGTPVAKADPLAASKALPFKGTIEAFETSVVNFPMSAVNATGSGHATHLGRYTITYSVLVNLITLQGSDASATFVAANGDELYAEGHGQATPTYDPDIFSITEWYTITGGTGRFEGASGNIVFNRMINLPLGDVWGTMDGAIIFELGN